MQYSLPFASFFFVRFTFLLEPIHKGLWNCIVFFPRKQEETWNHEKCGFLDWFSNFVRLFQVMKYDSHSTCDSLNMSTAIFPQVFGSQQETKIHDMPGTFSRTKIFVFCCNNFLSSSNRIIWACLFNCIGIDNRTDWHQWKEMLQLQLEAHTRSMLRFIINNLVSRRFEFMFVSFPRNSQQR